VCFTSCEDIKNEIKVEIEVEVQGSADQLRGKL
jgi:hypothetical protein